MPKKLLTSGQFAQLCRTSKDTILYYDKLGLLKPILVGDNNYRYYSVEQYCIFDRIKLLQDTGYSLEEIYQSVNFDNAKYLELVEGVLEQTQAARKRLELKEQMLQVVIDQIKEIAVAKFDELEFLNLKRHKFLTFVGQKTQKIGDIEDFVYMHHFAIEQMLNAGNNEQVILGAEIDIHALPQYQVKHIICTNEVLNKAGYKTLTLEAGKYACLYHSDTFEGHITTINQTIEKLQQVHHKQVQNIYIFDLYSIFSNYIPDEGYSMKYLMFLGS